MEKEIDALLKKFDVQSIHNANFRNELLLSFTVSGSSEPTKEDIDKAADDDYSKQKTYDNGYDRRKGFKEGVRWYRRNYR